MRRSWMVIALAALAAGSLSCARNDAPVPSPTATAAAPASVTLVSLSDLRAAVPDFSGWTRSELQAQEGSAPERSTHVTVAFSRGSEKMELEVADTGGSPRAIESLEAMAGSTTNRAVVNGYFKGTTIGAFPAVESWNTVEKVGELSVLIRRRYIIHVAGSGLQDAAPMRALAEAVDTGRLR